MVDRGAAIRAVITVRRAGRAEAQREKTDRDDDRGYNNDRRPIHRLFKELHAVTPARTGKSWRRADGVSRREPVLSSPGACGS